jgi:hypothetical protein
VVTRSVLTMLLGLALGARHALEPDHLAAVSVLNAEAPNPRRGFLLGAIWGLGHTAALLGVAVVLGLLARDLPPAWSDGFELAVAVMLLILGGRAILPRRAAGHAHGGPRVGALRPFLVGIVHGLAGSGALTALVLVKVDGWPSRAAFAALFGVGSTLGMSALSGVAGWPLARFARRPGTARAVFALAGACSVVLGAVWGWSSFARLARGG